MLITDFNESTVSMELPAVVGCDYLSDSVGEIEYPIHGVIFGEHFRQWICLPLRKLSKNQFSSKLVPSGQWENVIFLIASGVKSVYLTPNVFTSLGYTEPLPERAQVQINHGVVPVFPSGSNFLGINILGGGFLSQEQLAIEADYHCRTVTVRKGKLSCIQESSISPN